MYVYVVSQAHPTMSYMYILLVKLDVWLHLQYSGVTVIMLLYNNM